MHFIRFVFETGLVISARNTILERYEESNIVLVNCYGGPCGKNDPNTGKCYNSRSFIIIIVLTLPKSVDNLIPYVLTSN